MNKGWGGNLIIGSLVEITVANDSEETEAVDKSTVEEAKKPEKNKYKDK